MRAIRIRRDAPIAEKIVTAVFKREDLVFFRDMTDRNDLGFKLMRVLSVVGVGEQEMVTVSWLGSSDDFEVKASDIDKAPVDAIQQGARLYATIALNLRHYLDMLDGDDVVRFALHRIQGEGVDPDRFNIRIAEVTHDEDDAACEDDYDQGEEDIDEFDGRGYRTRGGI